MSLNERIDALLHLVECRLGGTSSGQSEADVVNIQRFVDVPVPFDDLYVLELFSGHGAIAKMASHILGLPAETVDYDDVYGAPTFKARLPDDAEKVVAEMRRRHPGKRPVVWASVCCTNFSAAKTTGSARDLAYGDALVASAHHIAFRLNAVCIIVENPATGLLKDRSVINFLKHRFEVHYCKCASYANVYGTALPRFLLSSCFTMPYLLRVRFLCA